MANPADTLYSIVRETVAGTTPATPAFKNLDALSGSGFTFETPMITSDALKQNRGIAANRRGAGSSTGTLSTEFRRDTTNDLLIEGALGGTFASDVVTAGSTDLYHTVEKKMVDGATNMYFRYNGCLVSSMSLTVDAKSKGELSFGLTGMGETKQTAIITGATYTAPAQGMMLIGSDVGSISLGGASAQYASMEFSVETSREAEFGLFNQNAIGVSTGANRTVKLTIKAYRRSLALDTLFATDAPIPVEFSIGGVGTGYKFTMPAMVASAPKDEISGNSGLIAIELWAQNDATGVDLKVTRL
ncbi:phage tail tube protein [Sphingomonas melonis]